MSAEQLLQMQADAADAVAGLTGIKTQLVNQGWNEHSAEQVVIAMIYTGGGNR